MKADIEAAWSRFETLMEKAQKPSQWYDALSASNPSHPAETYEDLFRWECVACVSALDKLVHDLILEGMRQIYSGRAKDTRDYYIFIANELKQEGAWPLEDRYLTRRIQEKHKTESFQTMANLGESLSLVWPKLSEQWDNQPKARAATRAKSLARYLLDTIPTEAIPTAILDRFRNEADPEKRVQKFREEYDKIIQRRNQIVHQGDHPNSDGNQGENQMEPMGKADADAARQLIFYMGQAIYEKILSLQEEDPSDPDDPNDPDG